MLKYIKVLHFAVGSFTFDLVSVWLYSNPLLRGLCNPEPAEPSWMGERQHRPSVVCVSLFPLVLCHKTVARTPKGNHVQRPEPGDWLCEAPL